MNKMTMVKVAAGQRDNRGIVAKKTTIILTVMRPTTLMDKLVTLGYTAVATENGKTGDMEIYCYTSAEVDAARNPLRG